MDSSAQIEWVEHQNHHCNCLLIFLELSGPLIMILAVFYFTALGHIPSSSTASNTPSMNGQKAPRADRLEVCFSV